MSCWIDGGYCLAASVALENDFVNSLWTLSDTFLPEAAMAAEAAAA
jgi:hypothetical protein